MKKKDAGYLEVKGLIDIEAIAASLAASSNEEQGPFLNIFFEALRINCGDEYRYQMQLAFILEKLNKQSVSACLFLSEKSESDK